MGWCVCVCTVAIYIEMCRKILCPNFCLMNFVHVNGNLKMVSEY